MCVCGWLGVVLSSFDDGNRRHDLIPLVKPIIIIQRLTGDGDVFVKAGGALIRRELAPGEVRDRDCAGSVVWLVDFPSPPPCPGLISLP